MERLDALVATLSKALITFKLELKENNGHRKSLSIRSSNSTLQPADELGNVIDELFEFLQTFSLKPFPDSLETIMIVCMTVTRLEVDAAPYSFVNLSDLSNSYPHRASLANRAYNLVASLCRPLHGNIGATLTAITEHLLPGVRLEKVLGIDLSPNDLTLIQDHVVCFLRHLMQELGEKADEGVMVFMQNFSFEIKDRVPVRQKAAQIVVNLLRHLATDDAYTRQVFWFVRLGFVDKACHRLFACEVIAKILHEVERHVAAPTDPDAEETGAFHEFASHRFLFTVIIMRCKDLSGSVRLGALQTLSECALSVNPGIAALMQAIFITPYAEMACISDCFHLEKEVMSQNDFTHILEHPTETSHVDPLPGAKAVFALIERLMDDEQVFVRKTAIQTLCNLLLLNGKCMTPMLLSKLAQHCADQMNLVRGTAVKLMTELLERYPEHAVLQQLWVQRVMPRVMDNEDRIVQRVVGSVQHVILKNISTGGADHETALQRLPWQLVRLMMRTDCRGYLAHAIAQLAAANEVGSRAVLRHVGTKNNTPAWVLLELMARHVKLADVEKVAEYCEMLPCEESPIFIQCQVVETLRHQLKYLSPATKERLHAMAASRLETAAVETSLVRPWLHLLASDSGDDWVATLADTSHTLVTSQVDAMCSGKATAAETDKYMRALITYAELVALKKAAYRRGFHKVIAKLWRGVSARSAGNFHAGLVAAMTVMSAADSKMADQSVALFQAALKHATTSVACKVNICHGFKEMCITHWSLAQAMLPDVYPLLHDECAAVRTAALLSLVALLQEDYLKIKGDIFFHVVSAVCDRDKSIHDKAISYLRGVLPGHANLMSNNFIQSLMHFNSAQVRSEKAASGTARLDQRDRRQVFCFMLDHMSDRERHELTEHICTKILDAVTRGQIVLNEGGEALVKDTLFVLSSEELKLSTLRTRADDEPPTSVNEMATVVLASKVKSLTATVAKNRMIDLVIPAVMQLKIKLERLRSPLMPHIREFLREVVSTYKLNVNEVFEYDKQLAAEILFDIKENKRLTDEKRRRDGRQSQSSDSSVESNQLHSPTRPRLPAEIEPMLANLTPNVRRSVMPFLALACQTLAAAGGVPPVHTATPRALQSVPLYQPDGSPTNLSKFNQLSVVVDRVDGPSGKIPSPRAGDKTPSVAGDMAQSPTVGDKTPSVAGDMAPSPTVGDKTPSVAGDMAPSPTVGDKTSSMAGDMALSPTVGDKTPSVAGEMSLSPTVGDKTPSVAGDMVPSPTVGDKTPSVAGDAVPLPSVGDSTPIADKTPSVRGTDENQIPEVATTSPVLEIADTDTNVRNESPGPSSSPSPRNKSKRRRKRH